MMSNTLVIVLRLIHIVIGVLWVGGVVFIAVFLLPAMRAVGPSAGAVMQELGQKRRLSMWLLTMAVTTILSGFALYWNDSVSVSSAWPASGPGRVFGLGAMLAIVTAAIGGSVNAPAANRLLKLIGVVSASGGQPSAEQAAEMQRLRVRLGKASTAAAILLVLAAACMAVARYVPA